MREDCPFGECFEDNHHLYWPGREYTTPLERTFRCLPENIVKLDRCDHEALHAQEPPEKPDAHTMAVAVAHTGEITDNALSARKRKLVHKLLRETR